MNFIVLNGTTKNVKEHSVNLSKIEKIKHDFPEIRFKTYRIANEIKRIVNDQSYFLDIVQDVKNADAVIWSIPVYIALIPAQLKRFIELIFDRDYKRYFENKPAVVIFSSIKLYDNIAIDYMREICEDLEMHYCGHFSAGMLEPIDARFIKNFISDIKKGFKYERQTVAIKKSHYIFNSSTKEYPVIASSRKIVLLSDRVNGKPLDGFIDFLTCIYPHMECYDLNELDIKCGCISCFECGLENRCSIKDGFVSFYKSKIMTADIVIFLGCQKDRFLSWKWKEFFDRRFFSNHIPTLNGKQLLCIVSGHRVDSRTIFNYFEVFSQLEQANLCGIIFDDSEDDNSVSDLIYTNLKRALEMSDLKYVNSSNFFYEGARAYLSESLDNYIFSGLYADYQYYKAHNFKRSTFKQKIGKAIILTLYRFKAVREYLFYKKKCNSLMMKIIDFILGIAYKLRTQAY